MRAGALTSGEVDVASNVSPSDVPALEADSSITISGADAPGLPYSIFLNHSTGVFQDKLVRQAFERGIDIGSAVTCACTAASTTARGACSARPPRTRSDPSVEGTWEFDPALANKLLDEAGWTEQDADGYRTKDGVRLSAWWPSPPGTARGPEEPDRRLRRPTSRRSASSSVPEPLDGGAYIDTLYGGKYDIADWSFVRPEGDILRLHLYSAFSPIQNASYVNDPDLDALLVKAAEVQRPGRAQGDLRRGAEVGDRRRGDRADLRAEAHRGQRIQHRRAAR